jgi:hypothetical protein
VEDEDFQRCSMARTFAGLHNKRKARVNAVSGLLGLLGRCHRCAFKIVVLVLNVDIVVRSGVVEGLK